MAVSTTGSTVRGLVTGLKDHFYGSDMMYVVGTPDGVVTPAPPTSAPSGAVVAYDSDNDQFYKHRTGSSWIKLGSVA